MNKRYPSFLPIPVLIVIIAAMSFIVQPSIYYDPLWLIPAKKILFITATALCTADRSARYPLAFKKEQR
jgi:hypothetical protein